MISHNLYKIKNNVLPVLFSKSTRLTLRYEYELWRKGVNALIKKKKGRQEGWRKRMGAAQTGGCLE